MKWVVITLFCVIVDSVDKTQYVIGNVKYIWYVKLAEFGEIHERCCIPKLRQELIPTQVVWCLECM